MKLRLLTISLAVLCFSCDSLLEFPPEDVILQEDALQTTEDLQALLNSSYDVLGNLYDGRVQVIAELMSDNLATPVNNNDYQIVYNRATNFFLTTTNNVYTDFYRACFRVNTLMSSFDLIGDLSAADQQRIEAECRFIRALCHFQVVRLWAQPYGYTSDNSHLGIVIRDEASQEPLPRNTVKETYDFIIADLQFARNNLPTENGNYANKYSAAGLLAHIYFLQNNFENAEIFATEVIESGMFSLEEDLDRFHVDIVSSESIFGIVGTPTDFRSEGFRDNYRSDGNPNPTLRFSDEFVDFMSLNPVDERNSWIDSDGVKHLVTRFNEKERFNTPLIHLTGLKLIRAESLAETGSELQTAVDDINDIRDRAFGEGINPVADDASAEDIIDFAREEYRKETVCEGTWVDQLKRRGTMGEDIEVRGAPWDCNGMAIQFPNGETSAAGFVLNPEGGCD
jgi:hypothetical protein